MRVGLLVSCRFPRYFAEVGKSLPAQEIGAVTGLTFSRIDAGFRYVVLEQHNEKNVVTFGETPFTQVLRFRIITHLATSGAGGMRGTRKLAESCARELKHKGN